MPTLQYGIRKQHLQPSQFISNKQKHGIPLHHILFLNTPTTILNKIGWFKCSPTCDSLLFTDGSLSKHQKSCTIYKTIPTIHHHQSHRKHQHVNYHNQKQPQLSWSIIFVSCPPQFHPELQTLIVQNTNESILYTTVLHWNNASTTPRTNNHNHEPNTKIPLPNPWLQTLTSRQQQPFNSLTTVI